VGIENHGFIDGFEKQEGATRETVTG